MHGDLTLSQIADQSALTQAIEKARYHFAPRRDHLSQLFLPDVVHDVGALGSILPKCIRQHEKRARQPLGGRLERNALEPVVGVAESLA